MLTVVISEQRNVKFKNFAFLGLKGMLDLKEARYAVKGATVLGVFKEHR